MNRLGDAARVSGSDLVVSVRVSPRAKHDEIGRVANGMLHVRTTAPPADGKANKAVIRMLAEFMGVAPATIRLLRGAASRNKQFVVSRAADSL